MSAGFAIDSTGRYVPHGGDGSITCLPWHEPGHCDIGSLNGYRDCDMSAGACWWLMSDGDAGLTAWLLCAEHVAYNRELHSAGDRYGPVRIFSALAG